MKNPINKNSNYLNNLKSIMLFCMCMFLSFIIGLTSFLWNWELVTKYILCDHCTDKEFIPKQCSPTQKQSNPI